MSTSSRSSKSPPVTTRSSKSPPVTTRSSQSPPITTRSSKSPPQPMRTRKATGSVDSSSFDRVEVVSSEILTKDAPSSASCAQKRRNITPFEDSAVLRNASTKRKAESDNIGAAYDKRNSIRYSKSGNCKVETQSEGQRYTNHEILDQCDLNQISLERVNSQESRGSQTKHRRKIPTSQVGDNTAHNPGDNNKDDDKEEISDDAKDHDNPDTNSALTDNSDERKESSSTNSIESTEIAPDVRKRLETKWEKILGPKYKIIVARLTKRAPGGGLGISLEGTVDVEEGVEVR